MKDTDLTNSFWLNLIPILDRYHLDQDGETFEFKGIRYGISYMVDERFYLFKLVNLVETTTFKGYSVSNERAYRFYIKDIITPQDVESFIMENIIG